MQWKKWGINTSFCRFRDSQNLSKKLSCAPFESLTTVQIMLLDQCFILVIFACFKNCKMCKKFSVSFRTYRLNYFHPKIKDFAKSDLFCRARSSVPHLTKAFSNSAFIFIPQVAAIYQAKKKHDLNKKSRLV